MLGGGRVDTKQRPSFGSVQLQSDPMGDLYCEPHWAWFCSDSCFNISTSLPVLCSRGCMAWLGRGVLGQEACVNCQWLEKVTS